MMRLSIILRDLGVIFKSGMNALFQEAKNLWVKNGNSEEEN